MPALRAAARREARRALIEPHANPPDPDRRLRIGYVSPDFRSHCVAHFIEPLLAAHDRRPVEIFCYAEVEEARRRHGLRLHGLAHHWRSTVGVGDARRRPAGARTTGSTSWSTSPATPHDSRLLAFAYKPAPVQVTWIGFLGTTGLSAIDYIIAHPLMIPESRRRFYSETVFDWRAMRPSPIPAMAWHRRRRRC